MPSLKCSFCNKRKSKSLKMISNTDHKSNLICSECVEKCNNLLAIPDVSSNEELITSFDIYNALIAKIAGQEEAIRSVATIVYNHYKNIIFNKNPNNNHKFHSLVLGPSGSGKTMIFEEISKLLNVPCVIIDATTLTSVGYSGNDCDSSIHALFEASGYDKLKCERGIIVIDEFDKCKKVQNLNHKDPGGEGVQQSFLKLLDGIDIEIQSKKRNIFEGSSETKISTKNILFIFCGAFDGIESIIQNDKSSIDLLLESNKEQKTLKQLSIKHLIEYGITREIVGRFSYIVKCNSLTKEDLKSIIYIKDNCILQQYKDILALKDNIDLQIEEEAVNAIIDLAYGKCGVRSIRNIFNEVLKEVMFNAPNIQNQTYVVTKEHVMSLTNFI